MQYLCISTYFMIISTIFEIQASTNLTEQLVKAVQIHGSSGYSSDHVQITVFPDKTFQIPTPYVSEYHISECTKGVPRW